MREIDLIEAGIVRYDHLGTVMKWKDGVNGISRITSLWGKNGAFIYKDNTGYYGLGKNQKRIDLNNITEARIFINS